MEADFLAIYGSNKDILIVKGRLRSDIYFNHPVEYRKALVQLIAEYSKQYRSAT